MYTRGIPKSAIFDYLTRYRAQAELPGQLELITQHPKVLGVHENHNLAGHVFFANGPQLFKRWQDEGIIYDFAVTNDVGSAKNYVDFAHYMDGPGRDDGASIIDSASGLIHRVITLPRMIERIDSAKRNSGAFITERLPPFYRNRFEEKTHISKIGNRTILALALTAIEPELHAFLISQTPYDIYGMGKISWFNHHGIVAESYFESRDDIPVQKKTVYQQAYQKAA